MSFTRTSTCNPSSSGSDTSSTSEEGRLRQLFLSCDSNNDGFLDCNDLVVMCQKLNMTEMADDIIHALGAHIKGCITFDEFMRCRRKVLNIGSFDDSSEPRESPCHPCHINIKPTTVIPFGERDDRAHDADVESVVDEDDDNIQATRLDSSASDNSLVNSGAEYDSGAQDLSGEPQNLHRLIKKAYPDIYKKYYLPDGQLNNPTVSHLMDCANSLHLSRINSLKTELRDATNRLRNLQTSRDATLKELNRFQKERAKLRYEQKNQAARYEDRLTELHSVIAELQKKLERNEYNVIREEEEEEDEMLEVVIEGLDETTSTADKGTTGGGGLADSMSGSDLKAQLSRVVSGIDQVAGNRKRTVTTSPSKSNLSKRDADTAVTPPGRDDSIEASRRSPLDQNSKPGMGSRAVELRAQRQQQQLQQQQQFTGDTREFEWVSEAVDKANKLAASCNRSAIVCLLHSFVQLCPYQPLVDKFREILLDWDRIQACCDRIRSERSVLQITLEDAKSNAERLQCSLSQYEANYGALQRAHQIADTIVEILDGLVQLYESESKLLLLNCRAAGLSTHPTSSSESVEAQFTRVRALRRQAEAAAGTLLNRLDGGQSQTLSMSALGQHHANYMWERGDEHRLRSHLEQLRAERAIMIGSLAEPDRSSSGRKAESEPVCQSQSQRKSEHMPTHKISLSSSAVSSVEGITSPVNAGGGGEYDSAASSCSCCPALAAASRGELIEQAVLLQELYSTKEERADLRARLFLLEKEMRREELLLKTREAELQAVQVELDHWRSVSPNPVPSAGSRVDELCAIVSQLRVSLAMQQEQNQELVADLKRANSALLQAFEKAKKKYQARIRKLEEEVSMKTSGSIGSGTAEKQTRPRSETAL